MALVMVHYVFKSFLVAFSRSSSPYIYRAENSLTRSLTDGNVAKVMVKKMVLLIDRMGKNFFYLQDLQSLVPRRVTIFSLFLFYYFGTPWRFP
jgi:hypothetical protein